MNTKLTLTIQPDLIEKAKAYAREEGRSLSDLVETFFKALTSKDYPMPDELPQAVRELKGSFKAPDDFDYKKILAEEIQKKHQ